MRIEFIYIYIYIDSVCVCVCSYTSFYSSSKLQYILIVVHFNVILFLIIPSYNTGIEIFNLHKII